MVAETAVAVLGVRDLSVSKIRRRRERTDKGCHTTVRDCWCQFDQNVVFPNFDLIQCDHCELLKCQWVLWIRDGPQQVCRVRLGVLRVGHVP